MELAEFQRIIARTYLERDADRGTDGTFRRLVEEVGELARAIRHRDAPDLELETSDVLAWLASVASLTGVDLEAAAARYANGCPKCGELPCSCAPGDAAAIAEPDR